MSHPGQKVSNSYGGKGRQLQICLQCRRLRFGSWVKKTPWRRDRLPTPVFLGFPCDSAGTESACNVGDLGLIPGLKRSPGEGKGYPLQYSSLGNSMHCVVHEVTKSWPQLSDFHFHFPERMKQLGRSRSDTQMWMCLAVKVKSNAVKNNIA